MGTAIACSSGYGLISGVCTACTVTNCMTCNSAAATCDTCMSGYGMTADAASCLACAEGCMTCSSNCKRSCTACFESTKTAPNCECASGETWNSTTNTCATAAAETTTTATPSSSSANILKFAAMVLIALIALL